MTTLFNMSEIKGCDPKTRCKSEAIKTTKNAQKLTTASKRFQRCADVVGQIQMGTDVHYVSAGEWSTHDLLFHMLAQTGPAEVHAASWSITEDPCRQLIRAIDAGQITSLHLLFDWRVKIRCPEAHALAKHNATSVYLTSCHAKTTVIINKDWQVAIIGSANYTNNPRIECGIICCNAEIAHFHRDWISKTIAASDPFEMEGKHVVHR